MVAIFLTLFITVWIELTNAQGSTCTFEIDDRGLYTCTIINQIILDEQSMLPVGGIHLPGYGNEDVTLFTSSDYAIIAVFPSLIIDTFANLEEVNIVGGMNYLQSSITSCQHLERLILFGNRIPSFGGGIFRNCFGITSMFLRLNGIELIEDNAFDGLTRLQNLTLTDNGIRSLNSRVFEPLTSLLHLELNGNDIEVLGPAVFALSPLLETIDLSRNWIRTVHQDAFINLQNLHTLQIGRNLEEVPIFTTLNRLEFLSLSHNNIRHVSADSFKNVSNLRELFLSGNRITSINFMMGPVRFLTKLERLNIAFNSIADIQDNAFTMLENLNDLDISMNQLRRLNENSIRPIVQMRRLNVGSNRMHTIERGLFNGASNLEFISLTNGCFDGAFNITFVDSADFENRIEPLLSQCFNIANCMKVSIFVLLISCVKVISALVS